MENQKQNQSQFKRWFKIGLKFQKEGNFKNAIQNYQKALDLNPNRSNIWTNKGISHYKINEFDKAIKCLNSALEINLTDNLALTFLGLTYKKLEKFEKAIDYFNKAIEVSESVFAPWYNKGVSYYLSQKYKEALDSFKKALEIIPIDRNTLVYLAAINERFNNDVIAIEYLIRVTESNPEDIEAWTNLGVIYKKINELEASLDCYNNALKINQNLPKIWFSKGLVLLKNERAEEANICFDKSIKIGLENADIWANKGLALLKMGKNKESIEFFEKALIQYPEAPDLLANKGMAFKRIKKYDEAIECMNKAIEFGFEDSKIWHNLAQIYESKRVNEKAIECYKKYLEHDPMEYRDWSNLGLLYDKSKNPVEAIKCYDKALKLNPDNYITWAYKSKSLSHIGRHEEALLCDENALSLNNSDYKVWFNYANTLMKLRMYDKAIRSYDEAFNLNSKDYRIQVNKAFTLSELGNIEEAIKCYNIALNINPKSFESLMNKAVNLSKLEKYQEAVLNYKRALEINPHSPIIYINLAITFLNSKNVEEALLALNKGKSFLQNSAPKSIIEIYNKYELWLKNTSELFKKLKPIDEKFINSLKCKTLLEVKKEIKGLFFLINEIVNEFNNKQLPDIIEQLLECKLNCILTLSDIFKFKEINFESLHHAKLIFKKWNLDNFIIALNSLESFYYSMKNFSTIEEIPTNIQARLLLILKNIHFIDGDLSDLLMIKGLQIPDNMNEFDLMYINEKCIEIQSNIPIYQKKSLEISDIIEFLNQFPESLKKSIVKVLSNIIYISFDNMIEYLEHTINRIVPDFENVYLVLFDGLRQKSPDAWSYFISRFTGKKFKWIRVKNLLKSLKKLESNKEIYYIFLDDVIGSGKQFIKFFKREIGQKENEIKKLMDTNKNINFFLVAGIGGFKSKKDISDQISILSKNNIQFELPIKEEHKAFNPKNWKDLNLLNDLCKFLEKKNPDNWRGFNNCEFLVVLEWNTPDNTIGCIWNETTEWQALFPRVK